MHTGIMNLLFTVVAMQETKPWTWDYCQLIVGSYAFQLMPTLLCDECGVSLKQTLVETTAITSRDCHKMHYDTTIHLPKNIFPIQIRETFNLLMNHQIYAKCFYL